MEKKPSNFECFRKKHYLKEMIKDLTIIKVESYPQLLLGGRESGRVGKSEVFMYWFCL